MCRIEAELALRRVFVHDTRTECGRRLLCVVLGRFKGGYDPDLVLRSQLIMLEKIAAEEAAGEAARLGRTPASWITLVDVTGIRSPPIQYLRLLNSVFEANYPERSHRTVIFPVSKFVRTIIEGMLTFVASETRKKFCFCSTREHLVESLGISQA